MKLTSMSTNPQIDAVRSKWAESLNSGSAEAFVSCVTDDAVWLPPKGSAVEGSAAILEWLSGLFDKFYYDFNISEVNIRQVGDNWAVEDACFRSVLRPKSGDGKPMVHDGRYVVLWRKKDALGWRIDRYVDRADRRST